MGKAKYTEQQVAEAVHQLRYSDDIDGISEDTGVDKDYISSIGYRYIRILSGQARANSKREERIVDMVREMKR